MIGLSKNKKGFSFIEMIAVIIIGAILIGSLLMATKSTADSGRVTSLLKSLMALKTAANSYLLNNGGLCTGVSVGVLQTNKLLPAGFSPTGSNPYGGDFSIAVNASTSNQCDVTLTSVPTTAQASLDLAVAKIAEAKSYNAATKTYTVTF